MTLPRRETERTCLPAMDSTGGDTVFNATGERTMAELTTLPASASRNRSLVTSSSGSSGTSEDRRCRAGRQILLQVCSEVRPSFTRALLRAIIRVHALARPGL